MAHAERSRQRPPRSWAARQAAAPHSPLLLLLSCCCLAAFLAPPASAQTCVGYSTDAAFPGGSPGSVLSTLLVADDVAGVGADRVPLPVGRVEVQDVTLKHPRVGALLIALYWLPYSDAPADLPLTSGDLAAVSGARAVLKELHLGQGATALSGVGWADGAPPNATLAAAQPSLPTLTGTYRPSTPLTAFRDAGVGSRGRWVLRVADMGENWSQRSVELESWTLVLCPPGNTTLPPLLDVRMAQQALDLGVPGANALRGAFRGLASADRLQALSGGSLLPARGTPTSPIINAAATTTFSSYSDVADAAVAALVRGIDNIQTLYGLPYTPSPLIKVWLPWVELVLGGTELVLENFIWPGKIVNYALSIEVAVRTREAMTAAGGGAGGTPAGGGANSGGGSTGSGAGPAPVGGTGTGTGGTGTDGTGGTGGTGTGTGGSGTGTDGGGGGSGSGSGGDGQQEGCDDGTDDSNNPKGVIVGPNGPVPVDKQELLDTFCSMTVPGHNWLFSRTPDNATTNGTSTATVPTTATDAGPDMRSSSPVSDLPFGASPAAFAALTGLGARSPVVQPPSVASLEPLDFVPAPADGQWLDQQPFQGVFPQASRRPGRLPGATAPYPDPDALTAILDDAAQSLTAAAYNEELQKGLQLLNDQAAAASSALGAVASNPQLQQRGGPNAVMAAQALQAGAQTYQDVIQASQDSLKRMSMQDLVNKTQKFLKEDGMKEMMNSGAGDRFIWNLNKIVLRFQFQAQDGLRTTYQQYLYQVSDVNQIQSLAEELAALDEVANGSHTKTKNGKDDKWDKENGDKGKGDHRRRRGLLGAADDADVDGGGGAGGTEEGADASKPQRDKDGKPLLPTGETVAAFMARITAEAEATAARAFKRLDLSSTTGLDRILSV